MTLTLDGTPRDAASIQDSTRTSLLRWETLGLLLILAGSASLNLLGLNRIGYANSYYAAAVRSMLQSWHNFFYISFDPGGFVSVDKPPLGYWIQTASAKLLGLH
ncbi:MAG TPA: hypothetical protein VK821_06010, partial [Dehalococcoidia bacterium]|nr:hypothetical protein [Dehalococcoidia bacterium]